MTEKQFWASKWKPFEKMTVFIKEHDRNCECYLVGIDFEERKMRLRILDSDIYEDQIIEAQINITTRGTEPRMKVVKTPTTKEPNAITSVGFYVKRLQSPYPKCYPPRPEEKGENAND